MPKSKFLLFLTGFFLMIFTQQVSASKISIPFQLVDNVIIIQARLSNSDNLNFIFDTGNGVTIINKSTAEEFGLIPNKKVKMTGTSKDVFIPVIKNCSLEVGSFKLKKIEMIKASLLNYEMVLGIDIDGIIGYEILKNNIVTINYNTKVIEISNDEQHINGSSKVYDINLSFNAPVINAVVKFDNGKILNGNFILDTGSNEVISISSAHYKSQNVNLLIGKHFFARSYGSFGNNHAYVGRMNSFELGDYKFENIPVSLSKAESGILSTDRYIGMIGNEILLRFNITFDYKNLKVYLEPSLDFEKKFKVNGSGISLRTDALRKKIIINNVYDDTPGAEAGLKKEDEITEINGKSVDQYTFLEVKNLLRENTKTVKLVVTRDNVKKEFLIKLREII